jgi:6-pyruvoyltetrahydropterin/6-carboxytetrahydropterin synthase
MANFDHAILLQNTDPLLPELLKVYQKQGIRNSTPDNKVIGPAIKNKLVEMHPECRLVITRDITTCENMIEIFHSLLKDKLKIARMRFQSKDDVAAVKYFK